jgi:hypothetical protein
MNIIAMSSSATGALSDLTHSRQEHSGIFDRPPSLNGKGVPGGGEPTNRMSTLDGELSDGPNPPAPFPHGEGGASGYGELVGPQ